MRHFTPVYDFEWTNEHGMKTNYIAGLTYNIRPEALKRIQQWEREGKVELIDALSKVNGVGLVS